MGERPGGAEVLTRWCRVYAAGELDVAEATLLSTVCLIPLDKGEGKIRPVALGEVPAKLAQAALLDTIEKSLRRTLEPHQLSVRTHMGCRTTSQDFAGLDGQARQARGAAAGPQECVWPDAQKQHVEGGQQTVLAPQLAQQWQRRTCERLRTMSSVGLVGESQRQDNMS